MSKRFYKHKLLLDENMPPRSAFPRLNEHFDVKHVKDDLRHGGDDDEEVYKLATSQGRIVVTFNGSDFRPLAGSLPNDYGIIAAPSRWLDSTLDSKLTALLMRHSPAYFAGNFRTITTE